MLQLINRRVRSATLAPACFVQLDVPAVTRCYYARGVAKLATFESFMLNLTAA